MGKKSPTILLIEPDNVLARSYISELEDSYEVDHVSSAAMALNYLATKQPEIIILEIILPGHNGIDVIYDLQSYKESKHIPVVVLSYLGKTELGISDEIMQATSIYCCLYKPTTTPRKLAIKVKRISAVRV